MKIPPRSLFITQLYATVLGGFVNYWVLQLIIKEKRPYLDGTTEDPTGQVSLVESFQFSFSIFSISSLD